MIHLVVWARLEDGRIVRAGDLATTDPDTQGRFQSEFAYDQAWIATRDGFDLDPASLRGGDAGFKSEAFNPPLSLFDDALPDDWGRRIMARRLKERGIRPSAPAMLREMGARGLGSLVFSEEDRVPLPEASAPSTGLETLLAAAHAFERGELRSDDEFYELFRAGSTAGGARPKALIHNAGVEYIAKFPSDLKDHGHDVVGLEAVGLELARRAGLAAARCHLVPAGRRRVLLVERFDVTAAGGRRHMVSFRTLCKERPGVYVHGYQDLAAALRKYSAAPGDDLRALFRHAAFNAAFGNVDDHTKNFWMHRRDGSWRLAPAFDLVPNIQENLEHSLSFGLAATCPSGTDLATIGHSWNVRDPEVVIAEVCDAVSTFTDACRDFDVTTRVSDIKRDVESRLGLLCAPPKPRSPAKNKRKP